MKRFWDKVNKTDTCWLWIAGHGALGYGHFWFNGKTVKAYRFAWSLRYGPIPKGMVIRHKVCDNPACVNPDHLAIGTFKDNSQDMVAKGRQSRIGRKNNPPTGETNGRAKLTAEAVLQIREKYKTGLYSYDILSKEYSVTKTTIKSIINRKLWVHV
jgi:hypothetical protein